MKLNFFIERQAPHMKVQQRFTDISRVVNGNIEFGNPKDGPSNISGAWVNTQTPGVANTEFTVTHNLGRIVQGMIIVSIDQAAIIYSSRIAQWTKTQAFFKSNQASVNLVGFVI